VPAPAVPAETVPVAPPAADAPGAAATAAPPEIPGPRRAATRPPRAERAVSAVAPRTATPERAADMPAGQGAVLTAQQQGENAYRRALVALQEGRVTEAVSALEHAVLVFPRHEAARQTLVGLLLENGRADEAMRHAQLGLGLEPNQPQLAMVLARLQLERGGPAGETLLRSLPHAGGNAEYIAFLAGVLQKQGQHRRAAEQYEAALRLQPANGVWWMGLGISLQAENLRTNAREAFQKARAAGLSPALQEFVERRLAQLQ
jgi:MSHA biogenesis protein MshN